ncbi:Electron transfer flavoprotein-ubiquinone oxidoreductase [Snodgrassella alvi wkB2]|uniref:Electron transfer flavoprotein-ubiquinone oxidoreductase n=1 Tax=Snodgrassella alvi TaxID=1196083 RepID=A0ABD7Z0I4_9NEIS|nr:electron transfer flavoprotein-ubiquinone oxidoreductase [Snodgrassella alvi]AHN28759.1 Electron transfer flavoprotein-ubiquinone oxidoreductase [Snodgrassella alvi wkB2]PIT45795.1 electron transfer flavoprotein-ubiquinone oxidoreductase [Snodgrassella alvi]PIT66990.1 electron transfer flavoprotein-ubiquinone oxidoreductase [Snodgrassella alvi]UOO98167.1 electron transfer flavoprotein-ubiquinone oxidoreductase [Snodgrassella alvi wkB2]WLS97879.1 electron transfer flavoprotein-ubiquinone oxi
MTESIERESMHYDVVIVGAGPSGLAASIRLKQLAAKEQRDISVCIVDKGSEVGAHILSGAVIDPRSLSELIENWQEKGAPLTCAVKEDRLLFLTEKKAYRLLTPSSFNNHGNYIISLGLFCRWLAQQAEEMGVEIYPGFAAAEVLYHPDGSVRGIATGDMGLNKDGQPGSNYQQGMALLAKQTIFAEGCRGSLTKTLIRQFQLDKDCQNQTYGIGIKELWSIAPEKSKPGTVIHSIGWPLDRKTYGGSFLYHLNDNKVAVGFVVGLDYQNPYMSPFSEMQRYKTHPAIREVLEGGTRIAYGARALSEGGLQSLPKLTFPGGVLVGDTAGFLNVPRIKGIHAAMKSGMLAAEAIAEVLKEEHVSDDSNTEAVKYSELFRNSWLYHELHKVRNIRPSFKWGLFGGLAYSGLEEYIFRGKAPWTLRYQSPDYASLRKAQACRPIDYPKADGKLTFDRTSSVYLASISHDENQPVHLKLNNPELAISVNYREYASPETRYCPAGVYEIVDQAGEPHLQINAQNCVHCKTCDIKDPEQNINWVCPEGGCGPNYAEM